MQKLVALYLFGTLATGTLATPPAGPTYTIKFHPPIGRHFHYGMWMDMSGVQTMAVTASFSLVANQLSGGKYSVVTTIDSMTAPGAQEAQMRAMLKGTKVTQVVDGTGRVLSTKAEGPMKAMLQWGGMGTTGAIFPKKPAHIGDTWTGTTDAAGPKSSVKVKLVGIKSVGGKQLAVLSLTPLTTTLGAKTGPMTVTVETATGILRTMEMTGEMGAQAGKPTKMHMTVKLR
jgi:hypothetical protein